GIGTAREAVELVKGGGEGVGQRIGRAGLLAILIVPGAAGLAPGIGRVGDLAHVVDVLGPVEAALVAGAGFFAVEVEAGGGGSAERVFGEDGVAHGIERESGPAAHR